MKTADSPLSVGVNTLFYIPNEVGGTETYLRNTLLAIARQEPDVRLMLFTNLENHEVLQADLGAFPQVRFVRLNFGARNRPMRIIREQLELPLKVRASGVDVLWSPGYTAALACGCPQVVTIHDMQYKVFPQDMTLMGRLAMDVLVRSAAWRCRRIIADSRFSKQQIVKFTAAGPEKVDVVYLAASRSFTEPVASRANPGGVPYLLCVSALWPHKNIHALVEAFGQLGQTLPHRLVLVGKPGLGEPEVDRAVEALPFPERVVRLRNLAEEELIALFQGCAVFVLPSLYEGFGLPVLEGLAAGVPVVTTRCASIPEVGGEAAVYFDPADPSALARTLSEVLAWPPEVRQERIRAGLAHAATFSWAATGKGTVDALRRSVKTG